ncbi:MAG: hypothetical protein WD079_01305, partial [Phycisphaeraceae bacterium]
RRTLIRPPHDDDLAMLVAFFHKQLERLNSGELDAAQLAGEPEVEGDLHEQAAWTAVSRVLLNLDETINKE